MNAFYTGLICSQVWAQSITPSNNRAIFMSMMWLGWGTLIIVSKEIKKAMKK